MDCIQAQAAISEALDRSPVDAAVLEEAKAHCRECPQCAQYIRVLNAVRRAVPPQPPADLPDRIMTAIRAEAAQRPAVAEPNVQPDVQPDTLSSLVDSEARPMIDPEGESADRSRFSVGSPRMDRGRLIAWVSAAAVLLVLIGISGALGVMRLLSADSTGTASTDAARVASPEAAATKMAAESSTTSEMAAGADASTPAPSTTSATSPYVYVLFNGYVYRLDGPASQSKTELTGAGQIRMSFDASTPPGLHAVYTGGEADAIYIEDTSGKLQRFKQVTRTYEAKVYRLQSADLTQFGSWPSLPAGIPRPVPENNPDGSPAFAIEATDSNGTSIYRRPAPDRETGIAIPPGTSSQDPAAGNPNWTWWAP